MVLIELKRKPLIEFNSLAVISPTLLQRGKLLQSQTKSPRQTALRVPYPVQSQRSDGWRSTRSKRSRGRSVPVAQRPACDALRLASGLKLRRFPAVTPVQASRQHHRSKRCTCNARTQHLAAADLGRPSGTVDGFRSESDSPLRNSGTALLLCLAGHTDILPAGSIRTTNQVSAVRVELKVFGC